MATATTPTTPATTRKPRVRHLGGARYLVESKTRPGIGHQVDVLHLRCSCEAGKRRRRCWHLAFCIALDDWRRRQHAQAEAPGPRPSGMAALQNAFVWAHETHERG